MNIRRAKVSDGEGVLGLLGELKVCGYTEMGVDASGVSVGDAAKEFFEKLIEDERSFVFVFEEESELVGVAVCNLIPKIFDGEYRLMIEELVVSGNWRGKGIGGKLLAAVEDEAREMGISVIKVTTGTKLKANDFYEKHGYVHFENAYRKKLSE